jgi:hypothetical protein
MKNGLLKKVFSLILGVYISSDVGVKPASKKADVDDHDDL